MFYFKKLLRFWGKFSNTTLVIDTFYVKWCSVLTQYVLENWSQNRNDFLKFTNKYIFRSFLFFIKFYATKNFELRLFLKMAKFDHVYCTSIIYHVFYPIYLTTFHHMAQKKIAYTYNIQHNANNTYSQRNYYWYTQNSK